MTAKVDQAKDTAAAYKLTGINKNRCFNLLVVDDHNTDWSVRLRLDLSLASRNVSLFQGEIFPREETPH